MLTSSLSAKVSGMHFRLILKTGEGILSGDLWGQASGAGLVQGLSWPSRPCFLLRSWFCYLSLALPWLGFFPVVGKMVWFTISWSKISSEKSKGWLLTVLTGSRFHCWNSHHEPCEARPLSQAVGVGSTCSLHSPKVERVLERKSESATKRWGYWAAEMTAVHWSHFWGCGALAECAAQADCGCLRLWLCRWGAAALHLVSVHTGDTMRSSLLVP